MTDSHTSHQEHLERSGLPPSWGGSVISFRVPDRLQPSATAEVRGVSSGDVHTRLYQERPVWGTLGDGTLLVGNAKAYRFRILDRDEYDVPSVVTYHLRPRE